MDQGKRSAGVLLAAMAMIDPAIASTLFRAIEPKPPRVFTSADEERLARAEAKRQRKAERRAKQARGGVTRTGGDANVAPSPKAIAPGPKDAPNTKHPAENTNV